MLAYQVCECTRSAPSQPAAIARSTPSVCSAGVGGRELAGRSPYAGHARLVARCRRSSAPARRLSRAARRARTARDVDAGASVDLGRVLTGQQVDAHGRDTASGRSMGGPATGADAPRVADHGRRSQNPKVLAIVLAGGEGKRLMPLTADRAKPAVPFGGIYRLIDFVLSNLVELAATARSWCSRSTSRHSLDRHITATWRLSTLLGNYVAPVPAQQRLGPRWFPGSADAIYQSLNLIDDEQPDHRHRLRRRPRLPHGPQPDGRAAHRDRRRRHGRRDPPADRAGRPVRRHRGRRRRPAQDRPRSARSPPTPTGSPDAPDEVFASMGNYVFDADVLVDALTQRRTTSRQQARHGRQHHPDPRRARARATSTTSATTTCPAPPSATATTGATSAPSTRSTTRTWTSSSVHPVFNLYNYEWPIYTTTRAPAAGQVRPRRGEPGRPGAQLVGLARLRGLRRPGRRARCSSPRVKVHSYADHHRQRADGRASRSAATPSSAARSSTRTSSCRRARQDRGRPRRRTGPAGSTVTESGIVVVPRDSVVKA